MSAVASRPNFPLLPEEWQDELVFGVAEKRDEWHVVFTDFAVSGTGATLHEAIDSAGESLLVYLLAFARSHPSRWAS